MPRVWPHLTPRVGPPTESLVPSIGFANRTVCHGRVMSDCADHTHTHTHTHTKCAGMGQLFSSDHMQCLMQSAFYSTITASLSYRHFASNHYELITTIHDSATYREHFVGITLLRLDSPHLLLTLASILVFWSVSHRLLMHGSR